MSLVVSFEGFLDKKLKTVAALEAKLNKSRTGSLKLKIDSNISVVIAM